MVRPAAGRLPDVVRPPQGAPPTCCLLGAASLLALPFEALEDANAGDDDRSFTPPGELDLDQRLAGRYGLTANQLEGLVDGFDRDWVRRTSPDYVAARAAAERLADRMSDYFG